MVTKSRYNGAAIQLILQPEVKARLDAEMVRRRAADPTRTISRNAVLNELIAAALEAHGASA